MELEELKIWWQSAPELNAPSKLRSLEAAFQKKSENTMYRLQRSIFWEMGACVIFILLSAGIAISATTDFMVVIGSAATVYSVIFLGYLIRLKKQLQLSQLYIPSTLPAIRQLRKFLHRFIKLYFHCCMLCGPLVCLIALYFFFQEHPGYQQQPLQLLHSTAFLVYILGIICWTIFLYFFTRWYLQKTFGEQLLLLDQQIAELETA